MEKEIKQEGSFKVKKTTPKNLVKQNNIVKVDLTKTETVEEEGIIKVVIPDEKQEIVNNEPVIATIIEEIPIVINEVTDEEKLHVVEPEKIKEEIIENVLPDNINKLITFMQETGGTIEDYVRLNADYSKVDNLTLIKEYYKASKPYLDSDDIQLLVEDHFGFDEDMDEEIDIKKKKLAFKEETAKAKEYLESVKAKYFEEIKIKPSVSKEQNEALEFFNRYRNNEKESNLRHERFKTDTKKLFSQDFKGFDFKLSDKQFRYNVTNSQDVVEKQSDINNFIGKFLDKEGNIADTNGYHKALFTAMNSDKIAEHFYEQGKADAIKEQISKSKNINTEPTRPVSTDVFVNGLKVKAVTGLDSSKLRIKTKNFE